MKLEELLGTELYAQVQARLDEVNGKEPDKLKHVRYADLSEGGYVSKEKYADLETENGSQKTKLEEANNLIKELQKATKGDEALQGKITEYEAKVTELEAELNQTKIEAAKKVALLSAKVADEKYIDFLSFELEKKLKEEGKRLELDDLGNIKGWDDKLSGLKVQYPTMFASAQGDDGYHVYKPGENRLPGGGNDQTVSKEQFMKMGIEERSKFKAENESLYNQYMGR